MTFKKNEADTSVFREIGPSTALTFDDVLLVPQESKVLPSQVNIGTWKHQTGNSNHKCCNGHRDRV